MPETPTTLIGLVILLALGMAALLGWLVRHVFTTTLPEIQRTFSLEMKAEREQCQKQFTEVLARVDETLSIIRANQEEYRRNQEEWRDRWRMKHGND